jgi:hypothetical protein
MTDSALTFDPPAVTVSYPTAVTMHFIYDTELSVLEAGGKDRSMEIALAAAGAGVGLLQNFIKLVGSILAKQPIDAGDGALGLACVASITLSIVAYVNSKGVVSKIDNLVKEIRNRPKKGHVDVASASHG